MAWSTTYDKLRDAAARAVGWNRSALTDEQTTLINDAPNRAVQRLALARRWRHLIKNLSLTMTAGQEYALLPADFERFDEEDELAYSSTYSYTITPVDLAVVHRKRVGNSNTGAPQFAALGQADDTGATKGRYRLEFYPKPDAAYVLVGTYLRQTTSMSAGSDAPDMPLALHETVELDTMLVACAMALKPEPPGLAARREAELAAAAARLINPNQRQVRPLRDARSRNWYASLPEGRSGDLHGSYTWG